MYTDTFIFTEYTRQKKRLRLIEVGGRETQKANHYVSDWLYIIIKIYFNFHFHSNLLYISSITLIPLHLLGDALNILKNIIAISILWIVVICGSFLWNYFGALKEQERLAYSIAKSFFQQIVITRKWNAKHGGLYAQITETTQPNLYLQTKNRDLQINSNLSLTKINPAFMTRQISEIAQESKGVQFHITSLNPIRPENKATEMETEYLHQFELGALGRGEFVDNSKGISYFFMAPLITEKPCLKCHAKQGYKERDIRGGISVTLPFKAKIPLVIMLLSHFGIGLLGLLGLTFLGRQLSVSYNTIKTQAIIDALTGIPNRRSFSESILHTFKRSKRENEPLSIIMCDIDNFKKYNDTYGHSDGDQCLKEVAQRLQASLNRPGDFCARYGGEEFIVILIDTDLEGAMEVAERIRFSIAEMQIKHEGSPPEDVVTMSLGVATLENKSLTSYEKLIQYADEALFFAKESGRNQVQPHRSSEKK